MIMFPTFSANIRARMNSRCGAPWNRRIWTTQYCPDSFFGAEGCRCESERAGFTLLELLVGVILLVILTSLSLSIFTATTSAWRANKARMSAFTEARVAFDTFTRRLSQATLNAYWDYDNRDAPTRYLRESELHFIQGKASALLPALSNTSTDSVFFVAPLGITDNPSYQSLAKMLTACGFYVRFGDIATRPAFLDGKVETPFRFRLYQFLQPGERLSIYASHQRTAWFQDDLANWSFSMADNVIGLILRVKDPDTSVVSYSYDSRPATYPDDPPAPSPADNQLPPVVSATLVVIDEDSARRLAEKFGNDPPPVLPDSGAFSIPANYEEDIAHWEAKLKGFAPKIAYRIFTADIPLRGAKWSSD